MLSMDGPTVSISHPSEWFRDNWKWAVRSRAPFECWSRSLPGRLSCQYCVGNRWIQRGGRGREGVGGGRGEREGVEMIFTINFHYAQSY